MNTNQKSITSSHNIGINYNKATTSPVSRQDKKKSLILVSSNSNLLHGSLDEEEINLVLHDPFHLFHIAKQRGRHIKVLWK